MSRAGRRFTKATSGIAALVCDFLGRPSATRAASRVPMAALGGCSAALQTSRRGPPALSSRSWFPGGRVRILERCPGFRGEVQPLFSPSCDLLEGGRRHRGGLWIPRWAGARARPAQHFPRDAGPNWIGPRAFRGGTSVTRAAASCFVNGIFTRRGNSTCSCTRVILGSGPALGLHCLSLLGHTSGERRKKFAPCRPICGRRGPQSPRAPVSLRPAPGLCPGPPVCARRRPRPLSGSSPA